MKKLGIYFMMLAMMAVVLVGCEKDPEPDPVDPVAPVITIGMEKITIDLKNQSALAVPVKVTSEDADLTSVKVFVMIGEGATAFPYDLELVTIFEDARVWEKTYTAADFGDGLNLIPQGVALSFNVEAQAGELVADPKSAVIEVVGWPVPLEGPAAFTWIRNGNSIDGEKENNIESFGITINRNVDRALYIEMKKKGADKFVKFDAAEWAKMENKEDLIPAIEAAPECVDAQGNFYIEMKNNPNLNIVLATKYKGEYYIMYLKTFETELLPSGTKNTIKGEYKGSALIK